MPIPANYDKSFQSVLKCDVNIFEDSLPAPPRARASFWKNVAALSMNS